MSKQAKGFRAGSKVKYTAKFLQCTGQYTGRTRKGIVQDVATDLSEAVVVLWDDGDQCPVKIANIMLSGKPDYTGM